MKPTESDPRFPLEFGALAGIALAVSNQYLIAIGALVAWFVLRNLRPQAAATVVLVGSIQVGTSIVGLIGIIAGVAHPYAAVEMFVVAIVGLLLVLKERPVWAYLMIVHSTVTIIMLGNRLLDPALSAADQRMLGGAIFLRGLVAWLLVAHLRSRAGSPVPAENPGEPGGTDGNVA
ncbi:MAG: hypothetical protein ACM3U2_16115 [Deltaproteobacteria bacterium]